jgi:hypothetical protein
MEPRAAGAPPLPVHEICLTGDGARLTFWKFDTEVDVAVTTTVFPYRTVYARDGFNGWANEPTAGAHATKLIRSVYHLGDGTKMCDGVQGEADVFYIHKHLPYLSVDSVWSANPEGAVNIDRDEDWRRFCSITHSIGADVTHLESGILPPAADPQLPKGDWDIQVESVNPHAGRPASYRVLMELRVAPPGPLHPDWPWPLVGDADYQPPAAAAEEVPQAPPAVVLPMAGSEASTSTAPPPATAGRMLVPHGLQVDPSLPLPPQMLHHAVQRLQPWFADPADATATADNLVTRALSSEDPTNHFDLELRDTLENAEQASRRGDNVLMATAAAILRASANESPWSQPTMEQAQAAAMTTRWQDLQCCHRLHHRRRHRRLRRHLRRPQSLCRKSHMHKHICLLLRHRPRRHQTLLHGAKHAV